MNITDNEILQMRRDAQAIARADAKRLEKGSKNKLHAGQSEITFYPPPLTNAQSALITYCVKL